MFLSLNKTKKNWKISNNKLLNRNHARKTYSLDYSQTPSELPLFDDYNENNKELKNKSNKKIWDIDKKDLEDKQQKWKRI